MSWKSTGWLKEIFGALTQQLHAKPSCGRSIFQPPEGQYERTSPGRDGVLRSRQCEESEQSLGKV